MTNPRTDTLSPHRARIGATFVLMMSALVAIGPLTIDLYLAAFPQITAELATSPARVQLTMTATLAGLALGQLLIGSVSDAFGRRPPLIGALVLYVLLSLAIVPTPSVEVLSLLRFVQGLVASAGMVVSMAVVRDRYDGVAMGKVIARMMLIIGVAPILAPTIGAGLLQLGSWRLMFATLAAFGLLMLVVVVLFLPESLPVERRRVGGTRAALTSYRGLLGDSSFMGLGLLSGFYIAALFTYVASSTFVFQQGFDLSAQEFGYVFAAGAGAITAASQIYGALIGRWSPQRLLTVAVASGLVSSTALVIAAAVGAGLATIVVLLVLTLGTAGFVFPSVPAIALEANAHRAGSAAALIGSMQFAVGAAVAPITGVLGQTALVMAGVMFAAILAAALLLVAVRRSWRRDAAPFVEVHDDADESLPTSSGTHRPGSDHGQATTSGSAGAKVAARAASS